MNLRTYIYGHCIRPQKVSIYDAYLKQYVAREIPCGKCLHCLNTHVNEWVTRLYAQRKYSKYCYYVSLDYSPFDLSFPAAELLAKETAATWHNINRNKSFGLHPLVLCKNHLQDFFKRLRKNTNVKLQYFACGEYGTHAEGKGYGRPHFHTIVFSDYPISQADFIDAWTIDGYVIGRVDYKDMNLIDSLNSQFDSYQIFRYVCKYLQKADFDFTELATIDFHRAYFKSLQKMYIKTDTLFPELVDIEDRSTLEFNWREYIKKYSPFIVCSRRPAIGSQYFEDNLERFKETDFRLFGLPKVCDTFPRYYVRRTKEALTPLRGIGEVSQEPSSPARLAYIFEVLHKMLDSRQDINNLREESFDNWCYCKSKNGVNCIKFGAHLIKVSSLSFYDQERNLMYSFDGYNYKVWLKKKDFYSMVAVMDISEVLSNYEPSYNLGYYSFVEKNYKNRVYNEQELNDLIIKTFKSDTLKGSYDAFMDSVYSAYQIELDSRYKRKLLMSNSKQTF